MSHGDLAATLQEVFGHTALRPHQAEVIDAVLEGRDALLCLPTGGGKSLTYQLPALLLEGTTLVVSPLIALMEDQTRALRARGIRATCVHSQLDGRERDRRLQAAARGELDLIYGTPERLRSPRWRELSPSMGIVRMAVDEAHCVSQWGHDFRPDYSRLAVYREQLGNPPTLAVTATATEQVATDIVERVGLRDPLMVRAGIERPNLFLATTHVMTEDERSDVIAERLRSLDGSGIVYLTRIRDLEALAEDLRRRGLPTLQYHGGLTADERRRAQEEWNTSRDAVMLATPAFGLGVDKADCRFVLHAQAPRTLEAWVQELGRAGRDGEPAWCELVFHSEDVDLQRSYTGWANPSREFFLHLVGFLRGLGERLAVKDLADIRQELLLKERHDRRLELCLRWLDTLEVTQGSFETHDFAFLRDLDPAELPEALGSEAKEQADLMALLGVVRAVGEEGTCLRAQFAAHFGLPGPGGSCGACDRCVPAAEAMVGRGPRAARPHATEGHPDRSFARGDWVQVGGRHLGRVVAVERSGSRIRLQVEDQADLKRRWVDPRKRTVERLDG